MTAVKTPGSCLEACVLGRHPRSAASECKRGEDCFIIVYGRGPEIPPGQYIALDKLLHINVDSGMV